jgi:hypothetical protein
VGCGHFGEKGRKLQRTSVMEKSDPTFDHVTVNGGSLTHRGDFDH